MSDELMTDAVDLTLGTPTPVAAWASAPLWRPCAGPRSGETTSPAGNGAAVATAATAARPERSPTSPRCVRLHVSHAGRPLRTHPLKTWSAARAPRLFFVTLDGDDGACLACTRGAGAPSCF